MRDISRWVGRFVAVLTTFGVAVAAGFAVAWMLPHGTFTLVQGTLEDLGFKIDSDSFKSTAKVLGNIGLGGVGGTLVAALRPRIGGLAQSIGEYVEGGDYREHVIKPAFTVFAVSIGAVLSLIGVNKAAAEIVKPPSPPAVVDACSKPTVTIDRAIALRLARAVERPGVSQMHITANTAIPIKFEHSEPPETDPLRVETTIKSDGDPTETIEGLREALVKLSESLNAAGAGPRSLAKLDAIDRKLHNIETHVAGLAPRSVEMVR